jgi:phage recombination protein Bet
MKDKSVVKVETNTGEIVLSQNIVRKYLVSGQGNVTDQEVMMFIALCKHQRLNPFLREAYLIKYSNSNQPATIVVGKEAYLKRARSIRECNGYAAGVICQCGETGEIIRTKGFCPPKYKLVGGWASVKIAGWDEPLEVEVSLNEYIGKKKDGTPTSMWREKPATMIRKVALVQALREAFPEHFGGMYSQEEINTIQEPLPTAPVRVKDEDTNRTIDTTTECIGTVDRKNGIESVSVQGHENATIEGERSAHESTTMAQPAEPKVPVREKDAETSGTTSQANTLSTGETVASEGDDDSGTGGSDAGITKADTATREPDNKPEPRQDREDISQYKKRCRRNNYSVDKDIFGVTELKTCGATPEQLLRLRELATTNEVKVAIVRATKALTGYEQLSYLRRDEADQLIERFSITYAELSKNDVVDVSPPESDDMVVCPLAPDEKRSVKNWCRAGRCDVRESQGWCPEVDDPPEAEDLL